LNQFVLKASNKSK